MNLKTKQEILSKIKHKQKEKFFQNEQSISKLFEENFKQSNVYIYKIGVSKEEREGKTENMFEEIMATFPQI